MRLESFGPPHYRTLGDWLLPIAMQTTQGITLAEALVDELRRRHIVLPPVTTLENLCSAVTTRAQREIYRLLIAPLNLEQRNAIDRLLDLRDGHTISTLAWLRKPPSAPSARSVLAHIDRLKVIRELDLPAEIGRNVHQNRFGLRVKVRRPRARVVEFCALPRRLDPDSPGCGRNVASGDDDGVLARYVAL